MYPDPDLDSGQVLEREAVKAQASAAQLEPLRTTLAASQRDGAAAHARLRESDAELGMLRAEVALLKRALQDERRVSALRLQDERHALGADLLRAASEASCT